MTFKLIQRIIELSENKNWDDAKKEWEVKHIFLDDDFSTCLCGHYPIKEIIVMKNDNGNEAIIGNCCVNRFFDNKDYNKIFRAIKQGKVNRMMIEIAKQKNLISDIEYRFSCEVWRKRYLSEKQERWFDSIKKRILNQWRVHG